MTEDKQKTPKLGLDWERVHELRRIFWDAELRKAQIRARLARLMAERRRLGSREDNRA